jgi:hypothetical protein
MTMVRAFDLRDALALQQLADNGISFDSPTCLTQDLHLLRNAILAPMLPDLLPQTLILDRRGRTQGFAQLSHRRGDAFSRLRFLSPRELFPERTGTELIEALLRQAGRRNAQHILADAEERTEESGLLRREGFSVYSREDIWMGSATLPQTSAHPPGEFRPLRLVDAASAHALYCSIAPALVHQVEGFPRRPKGWVIFEEGELVGLFHIRTGPRGLWMEPIFHPGSRHVSEWIACWLDALHPGWQDPVYVCVRSYQEWVGPILKNFGFSLFSHRELFVRRVVVPVPLAEVLPLSAVEKPVPQATTYTSATAHNAYDSATANHR